jgi:hypothetical protein
MHCSRGDFAPAAPPYTLARGGPGPVPLGWLTSLRSFASAIAAPQPSLTPGGCRRRRRTPDAGRRRPDYVRSAVIPARGTPVRARDRDCRTKWRAGRNRQPRGDLPALLPLDEASAREQRHDERERVQNASHALHPSIGTPAARRHDDGGDEQRHKAPLRPSRQPALQRRATPPDPRLRMLCE